MLPPSSQTKRLSPLSFVIIIVLLATAAVLALKNSFSKPSSPTGVSSHFSPDDPSALVNRVASHILVQEDEVPRIAVVQDVENLRHQSPYFYKNAEQGDRVLVWSDKVVLYSVSRDRILAVLPVTFPVPSTAVSLPAASTSSTVPEKETATVEVRNGSGVAGRGRVMVDALKAAGLTVLPAKDAKGSYQQTVLVPVSNRNLPQIQQSLLRLTGAKIALFPSVEGTSTADFLILIGASSASSSL